MKFWKKSRNPNHPTDTLPTPTHQESPQPTRSSLEARTTSGGPIQRPLPSPAPYTSHPHITHYSAALALSGPHTICRCALPTAHGDAFTRRHHASASNGIAFVSRAGQPLTWEQSAHALLDALGVDARVSPGWHAEDERVLRMVFCEETVRAVRRYREVWEGVSRFGALTCAVEGDVFWWGRVNPRGLVLREEGEGGGAVLTINGPFYGGGGVRETEREGKGKGKANEQNKEKGGDGETGMASGGEKEKRRGMVFRGKDEWLL